MILATLLTGFLGAGKTTLLNRLLRDPSLAEAAVLINEAGEAALDHLVVETADGDGVMLLAGGCLCCSVQGDLVDALDRLFLAVEAGRYPAFRRLVIETSGLADPAPILQTLTLHPRLAGRLRLDGVVTLVDGQHGLMTLEEREEARRQVAVADRLVISKGDLAPVAPALAGTLAALAPGVPQFAVAAVTAGDLLDAGPWSADGRIADVRAWLRAEAVRPLRPPAAEQAGLRHGRTLRTLSLSTDDSIEPDRLEMFLDLVRSQHGAGLLRLKGLVKLADDPARPVLIQMVRHVLSPPDRLSAWPDADRRGRLVVIAEAPAAAAIARLFDACTNRLAPDTPDASALADNPLAIPGRRA